MFLMCLPNQFQVNYNINVWMDHKKKKPNRNMALKQWLSLAECLCHYSNVSIMPSSKNTPDMVFTANLGFPINNSHILLSNFATKERQAETKHVYNWLLKRHYNITTIPVNYEGQGDHLVSLEGKHFLGYGFRSSKEATNHLKKLFNYDVTPLQLIDPRWYHLDTAFFPLHNNTIMWYPGAFCEKSNDNIRQSFSKHIEISEHDAEQFTCNSILIDDIIITPKIPKDNNAYKKLKDYNLIELNFSEFIKSGGAAKCLCLQF